MDEELVAQARDCLTLTSICLRESRLSMHGDFEPLDPGELEVQLMVNLEKISIDPEAGEAESAADRSIRGDIAAGVRLLAKSEKPGTEASSPAANIQVELTATFRCEYACAAKHKVSDKAIFEFLSHNAKFNVWPYWREYVQATLARAQVPNITLPLMVIKPTKKKPEQSISTPELPALTK